MLGCLNKETIMEWTYMAPMYIDTANQIYKQETDSFSEQHTSVHQLMNQKWTLYQYLFDKCYTSVSHK